MPVYYSDRLWSLIDWTDVNARGTAARAGGTPPRFAAEEG